MRASLTCLFLVAATVGLCGAECYPCFGGTFNGAVQSSNCSDCGRGECSLPMNCSLCLAGSFSEDGAAACSQCMPGFVAPAAGSTMCQRVDPGFSSRAPFREPYPCPGGMREQDNQCVSCSAGEFSPQASTQCYPCPPGHYSPQPSDACQPCPEGSYSSTPGQTSAKSCVPAAPGSYALSGAQMELPCPASFSCPGGSAPIACGLFFYSDAGSSSCMPTIWLYIFAPSAVVAVGVLAVLVILVLRGFFSASGEPILTLTRKEPDESDKLMDKNTPPSTMSYQGF